MKKSPYSQCRFPVQAHHRPFEMLAAGVAIVVGPLQKRVRFRQEVQQVMSLSWMVERQKGTPQLLDVLLVTALLWSAGVGIDRHPIRLHDGLQAALGTETVQLVGI